MLLFKYGIESFKLGLLLFNSNSLLFKLLNCELFKGILFLLFKFDKFSLLLLSEFNN